ncbi:hypothetical protein [Singulisphaera acidiphila]|uniref:Uncharacterized protein n=1 Tax=Singulisphaera acidiphila (strain ATCC BAA-1392 / DSM 18658 / VKM B-2454 / MOB10) TaxID=886293 RepID=L0D9W8_SINAD|nr:hypothetical protein [Singulisphaera acidiphila]AGA25665.1 hypothetical protein Sinac_1276 [Singulisphaera acidiphila DSM 18658]
MMDTMFASLPDSSVTRFEDLRMDSKGRQAKAVCRLELTNRDVEAEVLARLARRGYDWTGKPRRQRGAS